MVSNLTETVLRDDVQTIRNILFGEPLQELQRQIEALENAVRTLEADNEKLRQALDKETKARVQGDGKGGKTLDQFKERLGVQLQELEDRLLSDLQKENEASQKARHDLHQEIDQVYQKLMAAIEAHQIKQADLVKVLSAALSSYQNES